MIAISRRYQNHLVLLCALTLVPVAIHSYGDASREDCLDPSGFRAALNPNALDPERDAWIRPDFDAIDWWSGRVPVGPAASATLDYTVVRSFNSKRLYYRPGQRLGLPKPEHTHLEEVHVDGLELAIHRTTYEPERGRERIAAYLLLQGDAAVANGYLAQLRGATIELLGGRRPMTLLMVTGVVHADQKSAAEEASRRWLVTAWKAYQATCTDLQNAG